LRGLSAAGLHRRNDERLMKAQPINPQPGRRLREIRECRGMSQGRLARALGVSVGTIQSYEDGRTHITTREQLNATAIHQFTDGVERGVGRILGNVDCGGGAACLQNRGAGERVESLTGHQPYGAQRRILFLAT
jgi:DNA-binding transcriptional regulator YiaG